MTAGILVRPRAQGVIDDNAEHLAQDNPDATRRFLTASEETFQQLLVNPGLGRVREHLNPKLKGMRSWRIGSIEKWLTFYRPTDDGIEVVRILHGARDLAPLLSDEEA